MLLFARQTLNRSCKMIFSHSVGIVSFGSAIPPQRVWATDNSPVLSPQEFPQNPNKMQDDVTVSKGSFLGIRTKSLPMDDEDTITLSVEAGQACYHHLAERLGTQPAKEIWGSIGGIFIGSESHPYAVKPSGTVVASALGLPSTLACADLQFACKAGTQAMLIAAAYVTSGMARCVLAIGADTAQAREGDALSHAASAGAAAYLIGSEHLLARLVGASSVANDIPDFWRKPFHETPQHAGRFTGEPAYFKQVISSSKLLLEESHSSPADFTAAVFHTPNMKFPLQAAKRLGFTEHQLKHSLLVEEIGNTYAAAVPIALAQVLPHLKYKDLVFVTAYGSGAGADSMIWQKTT